MMMNRIIALFLFSVIAYTNASPIDSKAKATSLYPVILVPGDGGSQLYARLNRSQVPHFFCEKYTKDFFALWINLELFVPWVLDCFVSNMKLKYDWVTGTTKNANGVEVTVPGFGNTTTVEWLDATTHLSPTHYYATLATALVKMGYKRGLSVRAAPYDFRRAANEMGDYFKRFRALIEETYELNGKRKVVLICHSMGNMNTLYFLNNLVKPSWKSKYIRAMISISPPWAGTVKALRVMASGENLGVFVLPTTTIRPAQRSFPSTAWMMPNDRYWGKNEILVFRPERNYTIADYRAFFDDMNFTDGYAMWKNTRYYNYKLRPPNVEVFCLHGVGVKTAESLLYPTKFWPDNQPIINYGDGDGTVNLRSLKACLEWRGKQKEPVYYKQFDGEAHNPILKSTDLVNYITDALSKL